MMKKCLSSTELSAFAAVCMVIDHFAAAFVGNGLLGYVMRSIGRMAFPIFLFLLTEGIKHTSSKPRYLARLALFAAVSELPFDILFYKTAFYPQHQNTIFTLFIAAVALISAEKRSESPKTAFFALACALLAADILRVDGGSPAVLMALFFGGGFFERLTALAVFSVMNNLFAGYPPITGYYIWNMAALLPISMYNGERGVEFLPAKIRKWGFYLFYPLHLAALAAIGKLF